MSTAPAIFGGCYDRDYSCYSSMDKNLEGGGIHDNDKELGDGVSVIYHKIRRGGNREPCRKHCIMEGCVRGDEGMGRARRGKRGGRLGEKENITR